MSAETVHEFDRGRWEHDPQESLNTDHDVWELDAYGLFLRSPSTEHGDGSFTLDTERPLDDIVLTPADAEQLAQIVRDWAFKSEAIDPAAVAESWRTDWVCPFCEWRGPVGEGLLHANREHGHPNPRVVFFGPSTFDYHALTHAGGCVTTLSTLAQNPKTPTIDTP